MHDLNAPSVDACILHPATYSDTRQLVRTLASTTDRLTIHLEQLQVPDLVEEVGIPKAGLFLMKANIIRFVNAFFNNSNHSSCFIYKDSLNVNTASTQLLLAILLLGATCISPEDDATAKEFQK